MCAVHPPVETCSEIAAGAGAVAAAPGFGADAWPAPRAAAHAHGEGRHAGNAAGDSRATADESEREAEYGGGLADPGREPRHGAGETDEAGVWRIGLDRDEGAGEGPQSPLRD